MMRLGHRAEDGELTFGRWLATLVCGMDCSLMSADLVASSHLHFPPALWQCRTSQDAAELHEPPEHLVIPVGYQHQSVFNIQSRLLWELSGWGLW